MSDTNALDAELVRAAQELVEAEARTVQSVALGLGERVVEVARLLRSRPGKLLVTGMGTSGAVARRMAHLLSVMGTPAVFVHPADGLHGTLGDITDTDVVIAISKTGGADELNEFAERATKLGAAVVALTSAPESRLAQLAAISVDLPATPEGEPGGMVAMGSTLAVAAWGDALTLIAMRMRGYDWPSVLLTHPGGDVGRIAKSSPAGDRRRRQFRSGRRPS
jgi:arabinose-5-phosphate isomerase